MSEKTYCDYCKKDFERISVISFSVRKLYTFGLYFKFDHYDFCSKECLKEWIKENIK